MQNIKNTEDTVLSHKYFEMLSSLQGSMRPDVFKQTMHNIIEHAPMNFVLTIGSFNNLKETKSSSSRLKFERSRRSYRFVTTPVTKEMNPLTNSFKMKTPLADQMKASQSTNAGAQLKKECGQRRSFI